MPSYKTHIIISIIPSTLLLSNLLPSVPITPTQSLVAISSSIIGSLIPDIDIPTSFIGRILLPISIIINKIFHHRGLFHSIMFYTIIFIFLPLYHPSIISYSTYGISIMFMYIGIISHILLDRTVSAIKRII